MPHSAFPAPPTFSDEEVEQCRENQDYRPMLFEWYKHIGQVTNLVASIREDSPGFRRIPSRHYSILVGLLNRCARLMLSNIRLASTGRYGETTRLLDRCIAESAIKVMWLSDGLDTDRFRRYLADSVRGDLLLRGEVDVNIAKRGGARQQIEARMIESIDQTIQSTGLNEAELKESGRLPDMKSMMRKIGLDERAYLAVQRMGSHAVHGTWTDLVDCYLEPDPSGRLVPRDHDVATQHGQFVMVSALVLRAGKLFVSTMSADDDAAASVLSVLDHALASVYDIEQQDWGSDFDLE